MLIMLIMVVQGTVSPPPAKPLARIRLCVNGKPAVITPNIRITLRVPKVTNGAIPAAGNSAGTSATNGNGGGAGTSATDGNGSGGDLNIDVLMEEDDEHASDGEDGLARCARKQAAGTLEEYEEDGQQLPGDGGYGSNEDEDEFTNEEIDIIHEVEQLALQSDDDSDDDPDDDPEGDDAVGDSTDECYGDFGLNLPLNGTKRNRFKPTGGKKRVKKDPNYTFCPLPHRLSILRLMGKHFCQHPILRERHGQSRTSQQIHRDAVLEMYWHCKANNLREVWAYLWTNWYTHDKWVLWARSSYEHALPRKRMTMLVEALWRNYKRMVLPNHNRPRVDLATFALVTQGLPPYRLRLKRIVNNPRDGRAESLRGEQVPIKKAWLALLKRPIGGSYDTDKKLWLCSCRAQKYHSYLLCKHLVHKVAIPDDDWWAKVVRRHTAPFYDIIKLLPEGEREAAPKPDDLGPRYWDLQKPAPLQHSLPFSASQNLVSGTHGPHLKTEWLSGLLPSKGS